MLAPRELKNDKSFHGLLGDGAASARLTSRYKSGSCKSWLKVKNRAYQRRRGA
jgi:hypothetical protein